MNSSNLRIRIALHENQEYSKANSSDGRLLYITCIDIIVVLMWFLCSTWKHGISLSLYRRSLLWPGPSCLLLYHFLVWRTDSGFNKVILKRLFMSKVNKPPLSLSRLFCFMMGKEGKIGVVVGAVIYDIRVYEVPAMKVAALRFTETARARIEKAGGMSHLTFDQLALRAPLGQNTPLVVASGQFPHALSLCPFDLHRLLSPLISNLQFSTCIAASDQ
ncbi:60S ribosomal protein L18 [Trifolium repens]|nr:60S ribosomal protein L18 [Trifolium repens]